MSETFGPFDDHLDDDHDDGGPDEPQFVHDEPPAFSADDPGGHFEPVDEDVPVVPEHQPGGGEIWHTDPEADDELREWLETAPPALDPPHGFEARLADDLIAGAEQHGKSADELVREVLARWKGT